MDIWIRPFRPEYLDALVAVNDAAFGGPDEGAITRAVHADGDSVLSLVASGNTEIVAHIEFFRIRIDGAPVGVRLGPMSGLPEYQRTGIGGRLIRLGLTALEGAVEKLVFVLGHDTYYPKFGFSEAAARPFSAPWSGPHFMALRLAPGGPETATLTYHKAFGG